MHIHDYDKWEDVGAVETILNSGGAMIQTRVCLTCGKRKYRKTNSVISSDTGVVARLMSSFRWRVPE